jgi:hypothetical protein
VLALQTANREVTTQYGLHFILLSGRPPQCFCQYDGNGESVFHELFEHRSARSQQLAGNVDLETQRLSNLVRERSVYHDGKFRSKNKGMTELRYEEIPESSERCAA